MTNMAYRNILVAVDGSVEAEWAFKKAVNSAKKYNAHLIVCHVIDIQGLSPSPYAFYTDTRFQDAEKFAEELLTNYSNLAIKAGVTKVETLIEHGSPKTKISKKIAPDKHVDLIVCGATGLNDSRPIWSRSRGIGRLYVDKREERARGLAIGPLAARRLMRTAGRIESDFREHFLPRFLDECRLANVADFEQARHRGAGRRDPAAAATASSTTPMCRST